MPYSCSTSECTKRDAVMAGGDELCENSNPLQGLTFDDLPCSNDDLCTRGRTENGSRPDCKRIKVLGPNLATCQLARWAGNTIKFELTPSNEHGRGKQTKRRWEWSGRHNKSDMESVNKG